MIHRRGGTDRLRGTETGMDQGDKVLDDAVHDTVQVLYDSGKWRDACKLELLAQKGGALEQKDVAEYSMLLQFDSLSLRPICAPSTALLMWWRNLLSIRICRHSIRICRHSIRPSIFYPSIPHLRGLISLM